MSQVWTSLRLFLLMTLLTGVIYPLVVTGVAQLALSHKANGSLVIVNDRVVGSELIGQKFSSDQYFWPRPSAIEYQSLPSAGSNLALTSARLQEQVRARREHLIAASDTVIPADLLYASGSGLDPHISLQAAYFQLNRVAQARGLDREKILQLIGALSRKKYVNVLLLNKAMDDFQKGVLP